MENVEKSRFDSLIDDYFKFCEEVEKKQIPEVKRTILKIVEEVFIGHERDKSFNFTENPRRIAEIDADLFTKSLIAAFKEKYPDYDINTDCQHIVRGNTPSTFYLFKVKKIKE